MKLVELIKKDAQLSWPELNYGNWKDTCQTLHRWTQIIGKVRFSKSPWLNHSWHSTFYVTERGLTTSVIHDKNLSFSMEFDFVSHLLRIIPSNTRPVTFPLCSESVASFYGRSIATLRDLGIECSFLDAPNELADTMPFSQDRVHRTYDPEYAHRFWRILLNSDRVMKNFRAQFIGKASPVHFFWGGFDLAVTRFSGRRAPEHPGGIPHLPDRVTREAYSHEVSSCGFWPGNERFPFPAFYSYAYPRPEGFDLSPVPAEAFFHPGLGEFLLPYAKAREAESPDTLLEIFFQSTYEAAAERGHWDRKAAEESPYLEMIRAQKAA